MLDVSTVTIDEKYPRDVSEICNVVSEANWCRATCRLKEMLSQEGSEHSKQLKKYQCIMFAGMPSFLVGFVACFFLIFFGAANNSTAMIVIGALFGIVFLVGIFLFMFGAIRASSYEEKVIRDAFYGLEAEELTEVAKICSPEGRVRMEVVDIKDSGFSVRARLCDLEDEASKTSNATAVALPVAYPMEAADDKVVVATYEDPSAPMLKSLI